MPEEIIQWFIKGWNVSRQGAEQIWSLLTDKEKQMYLGAYRQSDLGKRAPPVIPGKAEPLPVEEAPPEEFVELDPSKILPSEVLKSLQQSESLDEVKSWLQTYIKEGRITAEQAVAVGNWVVETTRIPRERELARTEAERPFVEGRGRAEAFFRRFQEQPEVSEIAQTLPALPSAAGVYASFLEKMSPAMRAYYEPRMGQIYGEFGGAAARQRGFFPPAPPEPVSLGEEIERYRQQAIDWTPTSLTAPTEEVYDRVAFGPGGMRGMAATAAEVATRKYAEAMAERKGLLAEAEAGGFPDLATFFGYEPPKPRAKPTDPWAGYLKSYPFLEKFMAEPPRQRGFFPSRYKPPTRWLTF